MPDNPTGTVASADLAKRVCAVADEHELAVISDEIYRDLAYEPHELCSVAEFLPERCFTTGGLSKSMALGGWRIGFARVPANALGQRVLDSMIGIGVLAGTAFGDHPGALRFRAASSLLYGTTTEQRWQALGSPDPTGLCEDIFVPSLLDS